MNRPGKDLRCDRCHEKACHFLREMRDRPMFVCTSCGHVWTCGHSGGKWAVLVPEKESPDV